MRLQLDSFPTGASERYVGLLNDFRGMLRSAMGRDPADTRTRGLLKRSLLDRASTYRDIEIAMLELEIDTVTQSARDQVLTDLDLDDKTQLSIIDEYKERLLEHASTELTSQIQRDMAQTLRTLEEFRLEVFMQRQRGIPDEDAHAKALMNAREATQYFFRDRAGRNHKSQKFVRTMVRHTLLVGAMEVYAMHAAAYGADHLEVVHPDQNATYAGMRIGFRREQDLPLVADLKEDVFHPNSNATLKAVL